MLAARDRVALVFEARCESAQSACALVGVFVWSLPVRRRSICSQRVRVSASCWASILTRRSTKLCVVLSWQVMCVCVCVCSILLLITAVDIYELMLMERVVQRGDAMIVAMRHLVAMKVESL
jgi:hypothetical protein